MKGMGASTVENLSRYMLLAATLASCSALVLPNLLPQSDAPELTVNITELEWSGDWVEVSWSGVENPTMFDAVALQVPADADPAETPPAKFKWATMSSSHLSKGEGSLKFRLLNHRADMVFLLVTNVTNWKGQFKELARSQVITLAHPNEPTQGHLARTSHPSEMMIQWTTADFGRPEVRWDDRPGPQDYQNAADGESTRYTAEDMCGGVATDGGYIWPGALNFAVMTDLLPNTTYYYTYGDEDGGWSQEAQFTTAPELRASGGGGDDGDGGDGMVKLLAIADLGYCEVDGSFQWDGWFANPITVNPPGTDAAVLAQAANSLHLGWNQFCAARNTTDRLKRELDGRTLLIHNGDISYALGFVYGWDVFWDQMAPLTTAMPYMTCPGNHERDWPGTGTRYDFFTPAFDSGGECGVAYEARLAMPHQGPDKLWYSFDHGPIHFLQYSTEHDFSPGSEQFNFILKDLQNVDRGVTPWVIVGGHRPIYTSSLFGVTQSSDVLVAAALRQSLETLFFQYQVDMTWHGHVHVYERTCPVYKETCLGFNPDGTARAPVHVQIGNAGAPFSWAMDAVTPPFFEAVVLQHGYLRVEANATYLKAEAINSFEGSTMDTFTLTKPPRWQPTPATQLHTALYLHTNYTAPFTAVDGVAGQAYADVLAPAVLALAMRPDLVDQIRNATLVQNPLAADTVERLNEIYRMIDSIIAGQVNDTSTSSEQARFYYHQVFGPVFKRLRDHPDGVMKGAHAL